MADRDAFAALTHIYDAAVNRGRWSPALDACADAVDAKAISLRIRHPDSAAEPLQFLNSLYSEFMQTRRGGIYNLRHSALQDPDWTFLSHQPVHQPTPDTAMGVAIEELDARADYAFLRKQLGVSRRLGVRLNADQVWFDAMSIAFETGLSDIPMAAVEKTRFLLPHITKAVEIFRTFSELQARYAAVLTALDRVKVGLAIAVPSGEIVVQNEEATRIFGLKDGLTKERDGRLRCREADRSQALAAAIAKASRTARGEDNFAEAMMAVTRPSDSAPFLIDVAPLRDSQAELARSLDGALLTIIDPERVPYLRMERFAVLYRLTPAEREVCGLIVQGLSVDEIAEARSTSPTTAKTQIASILAKTGVARRAELIRLVVRVLPPVE